MASATGLSAVEAYIGSTYNAAAAKEKNAVGFVMTIYRRRVASSFCALRETLQDRRDALSGKAKPAHSTAIQDEDNADDDTLDAPMETAEAVEMSTAALKIEEVSSIDALLAAVSALPVDTKAQNALTVLNKLTAHGYEQAIIFTQFTDTVDFLRDFLVQQGCSVMCYSGRGGEVLTHAGQWQRISRDDAKRRFKDGKAKILLCTDAAAEGLNFQFCGALLNYDMPWNPMRVEQRIGRIDRLGQKFQSIHIVNLHYDDTVETDVYRALKDRINLFGTFVGKMQPILAKLPKTIAELTLKPDRDKAGQVAGVIAGIRNAVAVAEKANFDLDAITAADLELPHRPLAAYGLEDLEKVLRNNALLPLQYEAKPLHDADEFRLLVPGQPKALRVVTSRSFFEEHPDSCELWSPGSPAFPVAATATDPPASTNSPHTLAEILKL